MHTLASVLAVRARPRIFLHNKMSQPRASPASSAAAMKGSIGWDALGDCLGAVVEGCDRATAYAHVANIHAAQATGVVVVAPRSARVAPLGALTRGQQPRDAVELAAVQSHCTHPKRECKAAAAAIAVSAQLACRAFAAGRRWRRGWRQRPRGTASR
jgi:ADP-ribosylglycohydrolase